MSTGLVADFDEVARQFALNLGKEYNREVRWWDLYGKNEHLASRPQYHQYKISVKTGPVYYGTVNRTVDKPAYVFTQWFHNAQKKQTIVGQINRTVQRQSTFTWSLEEALKIGFDITVTAGVPTVFGSKADISTELSLKSTQSKTESTTETFSISNTITVDPQTSVQAVWTITDREMEISWETDIFIDGWLAIWFEEKYEGHWLWFHPIYELANSKFRANGNGLVYRAKGSFYGVRGLEATLKTYEYPIMHNSYESSSESISLKEEIVDYSWADKLYKQPGE